MLRRGRSATPKDAPALLRRLRNAGLSAFCGIGLAVVLWHGVPEAWQIFLSHPYFAVTGIDVQGNARLSDDEVLEWAGVRPGTSIWDATPSVVRLRLQKNPWVERAQARRDFPNHVAIQVHERRPVALAQLGQLTYVDRRGRILGPLRGDDSRDFVVISGLEDSREEFVSIGLHRASKLLRLCERMNCFEALSEVHVDRQRGVTLFPMHTSVAVVLGWGSWRDKLTRSARVLAAWGGQVERLAVVDVSFRDIVVVRLREDARPVVDNKSKRGMRV